MHKFHNYKNKTKYFVTNVIDYQSGNLAQNVGHVCSCKPKYMISKLLWLIFMNRNSFIEVEFYPTCKFSN